MGSIDIDKAKVVLLPDEFGVKHFQEFYIELVKSAIESHPEKVKIRFIQELFKRLGTIDKSELPQDSSTTLSFNFEIDVEGKSYNRPLEIVKKLGKSVIYELRIDILEFNWYFRATFFPQYHNAELYYCVVYPFVKIPGYGDPTNHYRDLTHNVYIDTRSAPNKYFN